MYVLQLNYWRGLIDAWTFDQNIGGGPPATLRIDAPVHGTIYLIEI